MSDEIRVNGNLYSWGSIKLKINDEIFYGFTAISYSDSRERVKAWGMGRHHAPLGRSRGKYQVEPVSVTARKGTLQQLRKALATAAGGSSYGDIEFQIIVQYVEPGDEEPITVELDRCVWSKNTSQEEENPDPLKEDAEFDCMLIRRNGLTLFDNSEANL